MLVWSPDDTPEDAGRVILNAIFGVRDAGEIPLEANALFPVFNEDAGRYEKPDCAARRTDVVPLGTVRGVPVAHVPMGAFVQPCDWANRGLECDKMSLEAVRFHLDAVFGELHRQLGPDLRAAGLTHILLDSYEAGTPTWAELLKADAAEPDDLAYEAAPLGGAVLKAYPDWFDGSLSNRPTKRRWFSTWRHSK